MKKLAKKEENKVRKSTKNVYKDKQNPKTLKIRNQDTQEKGQ